MSSIDANVDAGPRDRGRGGPGGNGGGGRGNGAAGRAGGPGGAGRALIFVGLLAVAASNLVAAWWRPVGRFAPAGEQFVVDTATGRKCFVGNGGSGDGRQAPIDLVGAEARR
jgi:hypothetical protein